MTTLSPNQSVNSKALQSSRPDFDAIARWVRPQAKVLDLGCGDGSLLSYLQDTRQTQGYGIDIDDGNVLACVKNKVNVIQSDLESGLSGFESDSFDYVILSQTLQAMRHTERIILEMLRVGREGIVSFPNFGHWKNRFQILSGHMPVTEDLPYQWYDTPNVHLCTVNDFEDFCRARNIHILERFIMSEGRRVHFLPNLLGTLAVYRFAKK